MTVLAIDQGTSATKAVVVDDRGHVLALAEASIEVTATSDGGVEIAPTALWDSVLEAANHAWKQAGSPPLAAIGLANQGETILAWDRASGDAVGNAIVWQDRRSAVVCERLAGHGDELASLTGLELDPYFVAPKIAWLRQRVGAGPAITTTDTWMLHRLSGAFVTDVATAGRSLLLGLDSCAWSARAADLFGIAAEDLPTIVANDQVVGTSDLFGRGVPISGACVDQQAALFAERCRTPGEAKCTFGTGAFLLACTGNQPVRSTNGLVGCPAWQLDGRTTWCLDGQVYTVGAAVQWLIDVGVIATAADLDRLGGGAADAAGVTFVPALAGLAAPYWAPQATATFTGMSLGTTREHLVRATIDGIAIQVALLARAAGHDLGTPLARLRVDGGLTQSTTLLQVQADLAQCPLEVYPSPHATALGVAEMATLGVGGEAFADLAPRVVVEPSIGADEAEERIAAWQRIAEATLTW